MTTSTPRRVLVTGSASGIGLATAARFAAAGDQVIATVRRADGADALRSALADSDHGEVVELDVTAPDLEARVDAIVARHGGIDVVINNAGLAVEGTLEDLTVDELRRSMEVNFWGVARVTKAVLPSMREAGSGRLVAVSSISGVMGMPFQEPYSMAKFAVEGLYECLAPVAAMFGVQCTIVEPGPVSGDFITKPTAIAAEPSEPYRAMYEAFVSMRARAFEACPTPDDIAALIFDVCERDDPPLRIQDSGEGTRTVATKLADVDGSKAMRVRKLFEPRGQ